MEFKEIDYEERVKAVERYLQVVKYPDITAITAILGITYQERDAGNDTINRT